MGFAEGMAARNQGDGFFVIHRHAGKGLADVARRSDRIGIAVRTFWVDVNQAHLHRGQRILQVAPVHVPIRRLVGHEYRALLVDALGTVGVAFVASQPLGLAAPVDVLFRLPDVLTPAAKTEGLESHRFQRDVAREDHQVGPGDFPAVLLLDRPEQAPRLVQADIVRPTVERGEALLAPAAATAAVAGAVGAGAVPRHADKQRPVVAKVRRPPVLRPGHQFPEVFLQGLEVETPELLGVVETLAHRIGLAGMLVEKIEF